MEKTNFEDLFNKIKNDESLASELDIDELLSLVEDGNYFENKTLNDIINTNIEVIKSLDIPKEEINNYLSKLAWYRYIDDLYQLNRGRFIRWFDKNNQLKNGAIVSELLFNNNGTSVLCKNANHRYFQINFDNNTIFQKLSNDEELLLMAYEFSKK